MRIADLYCVVLQGPCNGIDTACSSSLVAAHNAHRGALRCPLVGLNGCVRQSIPQPAERSTCVVLAGILGGEASAAVAGGINGMLWHETTMGICQLQALRQGLLRVVSVPHLHCVHPPLLKS